VPGIGGHIEILGGYSQPGITIGGGYHLNFGGPAKSTKTGERSKTDHDVSHGTPPPLDKLPPGSMR
jgi:hypothetical protein